MTGIIILAAGASSRLGQPKQNLLFKGTTLLQHTIETAINTPCRPIVVILGANEQLIDKHLNYADINIIHNPNWTEGIASSIRVGINAMVNDTPVTDVVIMLCDQPFVSTELINTLIASRQQTNKAIVACQYNNTVGVPALFARSLFYKLLQLKGDEGAKVIMNHPHDVAEIAFEGGGIDIDTLEDLEHLLRSSNDTE